MATALALFVLILGLIFHVQANTEKIIFTAPGLIQLPSAEPALQNLALLTITPTDSNLRTTLPRSFYDGVGPGGNQTWILLDMLRAHRKYELRICWAATQPSRFSIDYFTLSETFDTPALIQDLAEYSEDRLSKLEAAAIQPLGLDEDLDTRKSMLFVRIWSAADYFTLDNALMQNAEPVRVDLILDPYILNTLPASLLPTLGYITALVGIGWFITQRLWTWLLSAALQKQHIE